MRGDISRERRNRVIETARGEGSAASVVIESVELGIPRVCLLETGERAGVVLVAGGDGAEIVVTVCDRGSDLSFVIGGMLNGVGRRRGFSGRFERGGRGGLAA